ncbi:MAG TPA: AbrB/MazE/SpoVT family DNA-binding domain-containing protein [Candidatus Norongarragalinales archaeon]|nr:AbrB/MazE/SpoVT family DNA-binding domain-containing protein [Candidatus Norongarragalinales archaeon]
MKFEGKTCPMCGKGKMEGRRHEADPGIFVDAFRCNKCGEIAYSEEIIGKLEALRKYGNEERHVVKVGSSLAVPIPSSFVKKLGLKARELVYVSESNGSLLIKTGLGLNGTLQK